MLRRRLKTRRAVGGEKGGHPATSVRGPVMRARATPGRDVHVDVKQLPGQVADDVRHPLRERRPAHRISSLVQKNEARGGRRAVTIPRPFTHGRDESLMVGGQRDLLVRAAEGLRLRTVTQSMGSETERERAAKVGGRSGGCSPSSAGCVRARSMIITSRAALPTSRRGRRAGARGDWE